MPAIPSSLVTTIDTARERVAVVPEIARGADPGRVRGRGPDPGPGVATGGDGGGAGAAAGSALPAGRGRTSTADE